MSRITERIIAGLLVLFVLNMAYQILRVMFSHYEYETVYDYTVSRSIPVEGIAIRSEILIEGQYSGIENYIFEDGTRVSVGESVAEFYTSDLSDINLRHSRELASEIKMLEDAQDANINNFSTIGTINRDIKEQLGYLTLVSSQGRFSAVSGVRNSLNALINKKQIATGMASDFSGRINTLRAEYDSLGRSDPGSAVTTAVAPLSGYFAKTVDGYETNLSPQVVLDYKANDYLALIDGNPPIPPREPVGKIITSQNWMFAAAAPVEVCEIVRTGQTVFLNIEEINKRVPAVITQVMQEKDSSRAVILLSCNQVSAELVGLRKAEAVLSFDQFTGLRVNIDNVRFQEGQRGVYVLEKNAVRFKLIDPVYEEQGFVLSRLVEVESMDETYVGLFDQIIKGNDLYDGKVIQ